MALKVGEKAPDFELTTIERLERPLARGRYHGAWDLTWSTAPGRVDSPPPDASRS